MNEIPASELILNADGSVYHLKLLPEDVADTIITVGDPDRVSLVSQYFDYIEVKKQKREFTTHTGQLNGKRITVISTGIGIGNIDIMMNELDALVNIDLKTRTIHPYKKKLNIIRLGTAGCLQAEAPLGALVVSHYAIGLDGLLNFYCQENSIEEKALKEAFIQIFPQKEEARSLAYVTKTNSPIFKKITDLEQVYSGITVTSGGFYASQGRKLRLDLRLPSMLDDFHDFDWQGNKIFNLEMETAALYGLSTLLGHYCCSISTIVAHRHFQKFSSSPDEKVNDMIRMVLDLLVNEPLSVKN